MANTYATPKVYANVGLALLKNNLVLGKLIDSEGVDKTFKTGVGGTVYVKRPPEFTIRTGATASNQDVIEGEVAVTVDRQAGLDVQFTSQEMTLNVDQLLKSKIIDSAMATIASDIDQQIGRRINEFHNWVGTPGNLVNTAAGALAAPQRLDEGAVPVKGRVGVMTPADSYAMSAYAATLAAQAGGVAKDALTMAELPRIGNIMNYMTQTLPSLTTGDRATTGTLVNGASQNVTYANVRTTYTQSLICDGQISKTYKAGEVFTIQGVNAVNPRTKADLGYLQQFTMLTDTTSSGAGAVTFTISPPIITSGAFQNVTAAPADNAPITHLGALSTTFRPNAAFHSSAIKLVSAKMPMPFTGEADYATDPASGLTVRYWRYSDGANDTHSHRWDVFFGTANVDRRLGTRFSGA